MYFLRYNKNRKEKEMECVFKMFKALKVEEYLGEHIYKPYTVLKFETTGLEADEDRIIEVGAMKVRDGVVVDEFQAFVYQESLPAKITELTGISEDMLIFNGRMEEDVLSTLQEFIGEDVIVSHFSQFDLTFLGHAMERATGEQLNNMYIDVMKLMAEQDTPLKSYSLSALTKFVDADREINKRAMPVCQVLHETMNWIMEQEKVG